MNRRAWLYQVAVSTGFRASELSSLVAGSFSLDEAVVLLERSVSKRRRYDRQELPQPLVDGLRQLACEQAVRPATMAIVLAESCRKNAPHRFEGR